MQAKIKNTSPYARPWLSWGLAFLLTGMGTVSGLSCVTPGLDLVTSGYSALACNLTKKDLSKITSNKQDIQLLNNTKILLDYLSQKILLIVDLEKSPYQFKTRQFNDTQWGFETDILRSISFLGYTYQSHLSSVIQAKNKSKSRKIANVKILIVFSKGTSNQAIIFPSYQGIVLGDVYFAEGAASYKIGIALPNKFVFNKKPSRTITNGQSLLTQTDRAAAFLGLNY